MHLIKDSSAENGLSDLEVKLVKEAIKTAEMHDADAEVAKEAKRVAQMLKNSDYPVFFTGVLVVLVSLIFRHFMIYGQISFF